MTKKEIAGEIQKVFNLTKKGSIRLVDAVFGIMAESLTEGERVVIPNFGALGVRQRILKNGRNPKTNELIPPKEIRKVHFVCSRELRSKVNQNNK